MKHEIPYFFNTMTSHRIKGCEENTVQLHQGDSIGDRIEEHSDFDALKAHNGGGLAFLYRLTLDADSKLRFPPISGSDCHFPKCGGNCVTAFTSLSGTCTTWLGKSEQVIVGRKLLTEMKHSY
jgi:hypothetical protein